MNRVIPCFFRSIKASPNLFSLVSTILVIVAVIGVHAPAAEANTENIVLEVPMDHHLGHHDLISGAELSIKNEISQRFQRNLSLSTLTVSVLINRNGEVVPVLTTTVSRDQWKQSPQVAQWTKYHDSYALLQRHNAVSPKPNIVAASAPRSVARRGFSPALDAAFDRGALTGEQIQSTLSSWD